MISVDCHQPLLLPPLPRLQINPNPQHHDLNLKTKISWPQPHPEMLHYLLCKTACITLIRFVGNFVVPPVSPVSAVGRPLSTAQSLKH